MALKTNFKDSKVISSVFVDEIANPGQQTTFRAALLGAQGKKLPVPVTGKPATKVVKAASPKQLKKQGAKDTTVLERLRQITAASKKKKE